MLAPPSHQLADCLQRIDDLKVFPKAARRILQISQCKTSTLDDLEAAVQIDPVLCARVLQVANSALFGDLRVASLRRAVQMLGLDGTRSIALALAISAVGAKGPANGREMYHHAVATSVVIRELARHVPGVNLSLLFVSALLHDLGQQLLLILEPDAMTPLIRKFGDKPKLMCQAERMHFGFDHAQLGAACMRKWMLPDEAAELVETHHDPITFESKRPRSRSLLALADHVALGLLANETAEQLEQRVRGHSVTCILGVSERLLIDAAAALPGMSHEVQAA